MLRVLLTLLLIGAGGTAFAQNAPRENRYCYQCSENQLRARWLADPAYRLTDRALLPNNEVRLTFTAPDTSTVIRYVLYNNVVAQVQYEMAWPSAKATAAEQNWGTATNKEGEWRDRLNKAVVKRIIDGASVVYFVNLDR